MATMAKGSADAAELCLGDCATGIGLTGSHLSGRLPPGSRRTALKRAVRPPWLSSRGTRRKWSACSTKIKTLAGKGQRPPTLMAFLGSPKVHSRRPELSF